jgi:GntR family transcriptional regulator/MocR family aminotransferase
MRSAWSTEILLSVDRAALATLRGQLEHQLRAAIDGGRLQAGVVLPSSRELAAQLGLSRGVVVEAYEQLAAEGYLVSRRGSGTRVGRRPPAVRQSAGDHRLHAPAYAFDFKPGLPDLTLFPRRAWAACLQHAAARAAAPQLDYPDARGDETARRVLAHYLARARAAQAEASNLVLCSGYTQGLDLAARVFAERGVRRVAVEEPCFSGLWQSLQRLGLQTIHLAVDEDGLAVQQLERGAAQAVVVAPAHQFPTGAVLAPQRRTALVEWARRSGGWIVEDDYDAEFRYDREPMPALQGLAPDRVLYIGTASKILAPALRLGWMLTPPALTAAVAAMKQRVDRGAPAIEQRALARFVEGGALDRHLRAARPVYRRRHDTLLAALARSCIGGGVRGVAAGLHVMVELPRTTDEATVVHEAARRGVRVFGASAFWRDSTAAAPALVLGFGAIAESRIADGIARLADAVEQARGAGRRPLGVEQRRRETV